MNFIRANHSNCNPVNLDMILSIKGAKANESTFVIRFWATPHEREEWILPLEKGLEIYKSILINYTKPIQL